MPDTRPETGRAAEIIPGVRRILAPNPSPMTFWGTNTYLLGTDRVAVIDPGPDMDGHLRAILGAVEGAQVEAILVTHSHLDHSPLCRRLSERTGAPVYAYGDSFAGRAPHMKALTRHGRIGGGEGVDKGFRPDRRLEDGARLSLGCGDLTALWTPGHFGNHMCFAMEDVLFSGDMVMGWASSLISPPDGDLSAFMRSCGKLMAWADRLCLPGHGAPVEDTRGRLEWLIDHRQKRERQILRALGDGPGTAAEITARIYTAAGQGLMAAAARNVLAHLIDLWMRERVVCAGQPDESACFRLAPGR